MKRNCLSKKVASCRVNLYSGDKFICSYYESAPFLYIKTLITNCVSKHPYITISHVDLYLLDECCNEISFGAYYPCGKRKY